MGNVENITSFTSRELEQILEQIDKSLNELIQIDVFARAIKTEAGKAFLSAINKMKFTEPHTALLYTFGTMEIAKRWPNVATIILKHEVWITLDAFCNESSESWS